MTQTFWTYRPLPLFQAPEIHTNLLWDLGILFGSISLAYFGFIFLMRNRLSARKAAVRQHKRELAPMISNFLFYDPETEAEGREAYITMKIEIRELLKNPFNRRILSEVLMDLKTDVSGSARVKLLRLYRDLGLHQDAYTKLKSWRWERVSQGIRELTEMEVEKAYTLIRPFVNDKRGVIRKQAQLATVSLREEGLSFFMDTARYSISEWQQIKLLEILRQREDYNPPRFRDWLTSENRDVVLFALRLIRHYNQNDAEPAIIRLLQHRNTMVKMAAAECIRDFRFKAARDPLKVIFRKSGEALKLLILEALSSIGDAHDLPILQQISEQDGNFVVRSKARSVMNTLVPGSALPVAGIDPLEPVAPQENPKEEPQVLQTFQGQTEINELEVQAEEIPATEGFNLKPTPSAPEDNGLPELSEQGAHIPMDDWDEALFDFCLKQELRAIMTQAGPSEEDPGDDIAFIPYIVEDEPEEETSLQSDREPALIEVDYQVVVPETGNPSEGYHHETRTSSAFDLSFIPLVTEDSAEMAGSHQASEPRWSRQATDFEIQEAETLVPAFGLTGEPEDETSFSEPIKTEYFTAQPEKTAPNQEGTFCIFSEFIREYDTESKLILLSEIPAVGGPKEAAFLRGLLEDQDARIREKAAAVLEELNGAQVGPEETKPARGLQLRNFGRFRLWRPKKERTHE
ncbi:HEAT repeat domain-containing protein [Robiginitalea sediminis]|uniref:HEAT repeat domain-containing protein n=1 Tax=Robiginitalea sediminis TaxID=1982593 RepID=UPI000B4B5A3C|nr:HEAT repeat domain-containing protein [Robiginitalea sediminis]